jgi:hypothetical protein
VKAGQGSHADRQDKAGWQVGQYRPRQSRRQRQAFRQANSRRKAKAVRNAKAVKQAKANLAGQSR